MSPRIGSLFSGYGGLDMAVENVTGGTTAWVSDIDPGACKILAHRYPGVPNLGDITTIDWTAVTPVEIVCAGFPCQDVSGAGKQAGLRRGTRTGLWHEVVRAIDALRPSLVVLENVRGLLSARGDEPTEAHLRAESTRDACKCLIDWIDVRRSRAVREGRTEDARALAARRGRVLGCRRRAVARAKRHERRLVRAIGTVLGALADLGYDAVWHGLRAADIGAPHGRFRIFILAWPRADAERRGLDGWTPHEIRGAIQRAAAAGSGEVSGSAAHPGGEHRVERRVAEPSQAASGRSLSEPAGRDRAPLMPTPVADDGKGARFHTGGNPMLGEVARLLPTPAVNDMGEGKTPDAWDAWTDRMKAEHGNGNGHGKSLSIEAQRLMPTPVTEPLSGNGHARDLGTEVRLLPTPTGMDSHASGGGYNGQSNVTLTDATQRQPDRWGIYADAIHRWEHITRPAPPPTEPSAAGTPRLSARFSEWLMGVRDGWITDVPGITRNEALKAAGNGVVPQQAEAAIRYLLPIYQELAA